MKSLKRIALLASLALMFQVNPNSAFAQEITPVGSGCYDIQGGQKRTIMGIMACICGPGLECLCITPKPCEDEK